MNWLEDRLGSAVMASTSQSQTQRQPARSSDQPAPARFKFSVNEYNKMAEAGILSEDSQVELIEGDMIVKHPPHRLKFSVDDYYRMAEAGILSEDSRVELIDGDIIVMSPIGPRHASVVDRLIDRFATRTANRAILRVQSPIHLNEHNEPEPDLTLLRPRDDFYESSHPGPNDVLLFIEVMDRSADYDRNTKLNLYARFGLSEVWLIDLAQHLVEVYRTPNQGVDTEILIRKPGQTVSPAALPDLELAMDALFGPSSSNPQ